jgi:hypothetical protein
MVWPVPPLNIPASLHSIGQKCCVTYERGVGEIKKAKVEEILVPNSYDVNRVCAAIPAVGLGPTNQ